MSEKQLTLHQDKNAFNQGTHGGKIASARVRSHSHEYTKVQACKGRSSLAHKQTQVLEEGAERDACRRQPGSRNSCTNLTL